MNTFCRYYSDYNYSCKEIDEYNSIEKIIIDEMHNL